MLELFGQVAVVENTIQQYVFASRSPMTFVIDIRCPLCTWLIARQGHEIAYPQHDAKEHAQVFHRRVPIGCESRRISMAQHAHVWGTLRKT